MREFRILETSNGYNVSLRTKYGQYKTMVYENDPNVPDNIRKQKTMCRLLNDIATLFEVNPAIGVSVVAQLEETGPRVSERVVSPEAPFE